MVYMVTFAINIPQMLAYIPYMDPMGKMISKEKSLHLGDDTVLPLARLHVHEAIELVGRDGLPWVEWGKGLKTWRFFRSSLD